MKKMHLTYWIMLLAAALTALPGAARSQHYTWFNPRALQQHVDSDAKLVPTPRLADSTTLALDTIDLEPSVLYLPLIFDQQQLPAPSPISTPKLGRADSSKGTLRYDRSWIDAAQRTQARTRATRYGAMVQQPWLVRYNERTLPQAPKEYAYTPNPADNRLTVGQIGHEPTKIEPVTTDRQLMKRRNWLHTLQASVHFTQAYMSDNWYQGGENNVNILGDVQWSFNLNQTLHPKLLFNNTVHYKLGVMTAHNDSLRNWAINEDNFQFNSQLGYKAVKNWYYSATLQLKTQLFNNYKSNTRTMTAAFLSPGELNVGLGMTYNYKDKEGIKTFSLSLSPLSYNLKVCRNNTDLDPTTFGIDKGHKTKHNFGSKMEGKFTWAISPNVQWTSRLYFFTNYEWAQGDWENTLNFSVTRHLSTQLYVHLRYDKSHTRDDDWRYWQLKEILSFGLTYRFSTE